MKSNPLSRLTASDARYAIPLDDFDSETPTEVQLHLPPRAGIAMMEAPVIVHGGPLARLTATEGSPPDVRIDVEEAHAISNSGQGLAQLSTEVIHLIDDMLDTASSLSLQTTSSRLHEMREQIPRWKAMEKMVAALRGQAIFQARQMAQARFGPALEEAGNRLAVEQEQAACVSRDPVLRLMHGLCFILGSGLIGWALRIDGDPKDANYAIFMKVLGGLFVTYGACAGVYSERNSIVSGRRDIARAREQVAQALDGLAQAEARLTADFLQQGRQTLGDHDEANRRRFALGGAAEPQPAEPDAEEPPTHPPHVGAEVPNLDAAPSPERPAPSLQSAMRQADELAKASTEAEHKRIWAALQECPPEPAFLMMRAIVAHRLGRTEEYERMLAPLAASPLRAVVLANSASSAVERDAALRSLQAHTDPGAPELWFVRFSALAEPLRRHPHWPEFAKQWS